MGADFGVVDFAVVNAALRRDLGRGQLSDADFADATNLMAHIAGAVTPSRLGHIVTVESFFAVSADFLAAVLKTPFDAAYCDGGQVRQGFEQLEEDFRDIVDGIADFLDERGLTSADALLSPEHFEFNPDVRACIAAGQLTFWKLIHLQPAVFLPRIIPNSP